MSNKRRASEKIYLHGFHDDRLMKTQVVLMLSVICLCRMVWAAEVPPPQEFEVRGFIGVVVHSAATQVPGGDFRSIQNVVPNSPAGAAGVRVGDYILAVDGKSTAAMKDSLELVHALQGAPGSVVRLELKRAADGRIETLAIIRKQQIFEPDFLK